MSDKARFKQAFNRLAVATRLPADQADEAMQRVYWEGLQHLPLAAVEAAAVSLGRSSPWFPKLAEWVEAASTARVEALTKALPVARETPWAHECEHCCDTGWEERTCDGGRLCGRRTTHAGHSYVTACSCRDTNATYGRHHRVPVGREAR